MLPPTMKMIIGWTVILLVSSVLGDPEDCEELTGEGLKICYKSESFARLIELDSRPNKNLKLQLYPASNNTIAPYALNSSLITSIRVEGAGDLWAYLSHSSSASLSLRTESFAGMSEVRSLVFYYVTINFNNENPLAPLGFLVQLDFQAVNLTEVPGTMLASVPKLEHLNLRDNQIRRVCSNSFDALSRLKFLDLSGNGITHIDLGAFDRLPGLTGLALARNAFLAVPGIFRGVWKVNVLDLAEAFDHNKSKLHVGMFDGLTELANLTLWGNGFTNIPLGIFDHLTSLRNLDMSGNRIEKILPRTFRRLTLDQLDLSWNKMDVIETDTFEGLSVNKLSLRYNRIGELKPRAFSGLTAGELDLARNKLTVIGSHDFDGLDTSRLMLSGNAIGRISHGALRNVVTHAVDLRFNPVASFSLGADELGLGKSVVLWV